MNTLKKIYYKIVGSRIRPNYWSHSPLAKWLRERFGIERLPTSETSKGWKEYHNRNKTRFGYWLIEEGFDIAQDIIMFPKDVYRSIRSYISNRFTDKMWCLDTKLSKGGYHELNIRIIHGLFEGLVEFVENEKANMQYISEYWEQVDDSASISTASKKVKKIFPSREKGIEYLNWEISLNDGIKMGQSETAKEIKELYMWWKDIRPNRPDPYDASGWTEYCNKRREDSDGAFDILDHEDETEEERKEVSNMLKRLREIEKQYDEEDTEMLIRLIKIRNGLWT